MIATRVTPFRVTRNTGAVRPSRKSPGSLRERVPRPLGLVARLERVLPRGQRVDLLARLHQARVVLLLQLGAYLLQRQERARLVDVVLDLRGCQRA